jgi:hypothetical protein
MRKQLGVGDCRNQDGGGGWSLSSLEPLPTSSTESTSPVPAEPCGPPATATGSRVRSVPTLAPPRAGAVSDFPHSPRTPEKPRPERRGGRPQACLQGLQFPSDAGHTFRTAAIRGTLGKGTATAALIARLLRDQDYQMNPTLDNGPDKNQAAIAP